MAHSPRRAAFAARTLRFPKRSYGGASDGKLIWGRLTHGRVLGLLKNPSYAGRYVFGRYRYGREISPEGQVHPRKHPVAIPDCVSGGTSSHSSIGRLARTIQ